MYEIVRDVVQKKGPNGESVEVPQATVRCLESEDGAEIPKGDFDLAADGEMTRLKHVPEDPEWLVTSSIP